MFKTYLRTREEKTNILNPANMAMAITEFLRDATGLLSKDMLAEGVNTVKELKLAKNFKAFCNKHNEELKAFGLFIGDHQGFYDGFRRFYNWQTLEPFTEAVFRFNVEMPNKYRLLEITKKYELAVFAVAEDDIARFVLKNFNLYAEMADKFQDEHGRAITALETIYHELCKNRAAIGSPQWALEVLIKKLCYGI